MTDVNTFIKNNIWKIAKKNIYVAPDIPEKKLNNAVKAFNCEDSYQSVLAIYDNTLFGNAKEGLIFTGKKMLYSNEKIIEFLYENIKTVEYKQDLIVEDNGKEKKDHYISIIMNEKEYRLSQLGSFNYAALSEILNEIISNGTTYKEENQLSTLAEMSEELKTAYLKVIIHMALEDDSKIDSKELAEIFLLMTRLNLNSQTRFDIRAYITEIDNSNESVEDLLANLGKHCPSAHLKSIKISLVKDLININLSTKNYENSEITKFLDYYGALFQLSSDEINLAYATVKNDFSMLKDNITDGMIEKSIKELGAKATAVGVPLAAVYMSGSVIGLSATGMTSGLAALGMGGILGFSSMATGIGSAIILGVFAYKGVKHLTGANELDRFKRREIMLLEVIKQTQQTITLVIGDVNFIVKKMNQIINEHSEQDEKIKKLMTIMTQYQDALKNVDNKSNQYQSSVTKLKCPHVLDIERLKLLTSEPTKKQLFDFVMENYAEQSCEDSKAIEYIPKEDIDINTLDKLASIFSSIEYFNVESILKGKTSEGFNKVKGIFS